MPRKIIPYNPRLKALARKLRQNMTFSEILLWQQLKGRQMLGHDFDRQRPIDEFIVDFYCKDLQLAIEIDGETHNLEGAAECDEKRQSRLQRLGVRFLRFTQWEVLENMEGVLQTIEGWIEENSKR